MISETIYPNWSELIQLLKPLKCHVRVLLKDDDDPSPWDSPLFEPVPTHIELPKYGPIQKTNVRWLEIDPVEEEYVGRRVPNRQTDHTKDIQTILQHLNLQYTLRDRFFRILF